ncbi:tyrosine-type recombinase/integrase [Rhodovulum sulfidophilum]|uniref:tyrosine-type recombinase/integrase n=1 Tax=Rhodovulum sulfidophilum TaxID=35806 RepID=UPI003075AFC5
MTSIRKGGQRAVNSACLKDVSPHFLRQTSAVHMAEAGVPVSEISQYLGRSNVSVTARVHAWHSPNPLRRASDVPDFTTLRKVHGTRARFAKSTQAIGKMVGDKRFELLTSSM